MYMTCYTYIHTSYIHTTTNFGAKWIKCNKTNFFFRLYSRTVIILRAIPPLRDLIRPYQQLFTPCSALHTRIDAREPQTPRSRGGRKRAIGAQAGH